MDAVLNATVAKDVHFERLRRYPNVIGAGVGFRERKGRKTDEMSVQVFVHRKLPLSALPHWAVLPTLLGGADVESPVRVDVVETEPIFAYADAARYRPAQPGCSIGHQALSDAGTLGGWAGDTTDNTTVLLTCNHVAANIDVAPPTTGICQPGQYDGGSFPNDQIGALKRFNPISITPPPGSPPGTLPPPSPIDAAITTITVPHSLELLDLNVDVIFELGAPALKTTVQKRGRTTKLTTDGTIDTVNGTITVNYYKIGTGYVQGVVQNSFRVTWPSTGSAFGAAGDSGSTILSKTPGTLKGTFPVLGLLFAGTSSAIWGNDINSIFQILQLETICALVVKSLLSSTAATSSTAMAAGWVDSKASQLRALRDSILTKTGFGAQAADLIQREAARISRALLEDHEAFGLAVEALAPLAHQATNHALLEVVIDDAMVHRFKRLADRLGEQVPDLARPLSVASQAMAQIKGSNLRSILNAAQSLGGGTVRKKR